jgi:hypothetical protein
MKLFQNPILKEYTFHKGTPLLRQRKLDGRNPSRCKNKRNIIRYHPLFWFQRIVFGRHNFKIWIYGDLKRFPRYRFFHLFENPTNTVNTKLNLIK